MNVDLERSAKALPLAVAAIYVAGFLVVAFHLARYGASSLELFKIQYLAAGFWFGFVLAVYFCFLQGVRVIWRLGVLAVRGIPAPEKREKRGVLRSLAGSAVVNGVLILLLVGVMAAAPRRFPIRPLLRLFFALALIDVFLQLWPSIREIEKSLLEHHDSLRRSRWLPVFWLPRILPGLLIMVCTLQFSEAFYPYLSFSLGGGLPRSVVFVLNEGTGATSSFLVRDGAGPRTIPYQLLLENENSFVIVSPKAGEKAIEFDRKSVAAMIVLESPKKP